MTRRLVAAALVVLALVAGTASAQTDPSYQSLQVSTPDLFVQEHSNRLCRALIALRFPVGPCPHVWVGDNLAELMAQQICPDDPVVSSCRAARQVSAIATGGGTVLSPDWVDLPFGLAMPDEQSVLLHVHELLHRVQASRATGYTPGGSLAIASWEWTDEDRYWEEALVEAVSQDILPAVYRRVYPRFEAPRHPAVAYAQSVRRLRAVTARATRGSWRSRRARSLRAALLRAPIEVRRQALADLTTR